MLIVARTGVELPRASKQDILSFIDAGSKIRRPTLVGMQLHDEPAVGSPDFVSARPRLKAKDLVSLLLRHFSGGRRAAAPRCRTVVNVFTPSGMPAVKIRCE